MTQYILTGFARLRSANAIPEGYEERVKDVITKGIAYLRKRLSEDLKELESNKSDLSGDIAGDLQVQCLYTLSGFPETAIEPATRRAYDIFRKQAAQMVATPPTATAGHDSADAPSNGGRQNG